MKQKFNLAIPKPCTEQFDQFRPTAGGAFCSSCQKEVIDFRSMTDKEIMEYFKNPPQKTCGFFRESQLKTYSDVGLGNQKQSRWAFLGAVGISLLALFSGNEAKAQSSAPAVDVYTPEKGADKTKLSIQGDSTGYIVEGVVVDKADKSTLPGVNVTLKGAPEIGTVTDIDGNFRLSHLKNGDVLIFSYVGYNAQSIAIRAKDFQQTNILSIKLEFNGDILGEVNINQLYTSKPTFWQRFKGLLGI